MAIWTRVLLIFLGIGVAFAVSGETLIFEDNFDFLDFSKWKHEITESGGGNWESVSFEYYTNNRSNTFVRNSILYIKPTLSIDHLGRLDSGSLDLWGGEPGDVCTGGMSYGCFRTGTPENILPPIQSARLRTAESFSFTYGRVEIRAKLPRGDWLWPALWLLPRDNVYGHWPASGEIDIMESRGNVGVPGGLQTFGSTLHWGTDYSTNCWPLTHTERTLPSGTFGDQFHVFGLYWDQHGITTYLDTPNNVVLQVNVTDYWKFGDTLQHWASRGYDNPWAGARGPAPFDQRFFLIMNLAVGGTGGYFPDSTPNKPWKDSSPHAAADFWAARSQWYPSWKNAGLDSAMQIDWVRVWSLPTTTAAATRS